MANQYPGACRYCAGWLDAGEGVLVNQLGTLVPVHGATPESCPPPEQRKAAPPRENLRPGACWRCGQTVPASEGVLDGGRVRHRGDCPAYGDGYTGPTWTIGYGEPRPYRPVPERGYAPGQVLRATLWEHDHAVPVDAPGYRRLDEQPVLDDIQLAWLATQSARPASTGKVSVIVTVLGELPPRYSRDEDGNAPCDELVGEDGWHFQAVVRPATEQEAAPLLAVEAQAAHRAGLERKRLSLLSWRYAQQPDAQRPEHPDLDAAVRVPYRAGRLGRWATVEDEIRVDEPAGQVWTLAYNGADGDDWSVNNHGSYIAMAQPLTDERRALIAALRAEYAAADLADRAGVGTDAAAELLDAGWTAERATAELGGLTLTTAADAADALAHQDLLTGAGWRVRAEPGRQRFPLAGSAEITSDPATARAWLAQHPDRWRADLLAISTGIRCVHTAEDWSLWDDGSLVVRCSWLDPAERGRMPRTLHPAAVTAIGLVARGCAGTSVRDRAVWHPLCAAAGHTETVVDERERSGHSSWAGKKLIRHEFTLADGTTVWWELAISEGGWAGSDADHHEYSQVWDDEATARAAYRSHQI